MGAIRRTLAESHIAAVVIAMLLVWSMESFLLALWMPGYRFGGFVIVAIAIHGIPYMSPGFNFEDRVMVLTTSMYLANALIGIGAAWVLSRCVYGVGPFKYLSQYRTKLARRHHVA